MLFLMLMLLVQEPEIELETPAEVCAPLAAGGCGRKPNQKPSGYG